MNLTEDEVRTNAQDILKAEGLFLMRMPFNDS